jgi:hypothetical protein
MNRLCSTAEDRPGVLYTLGGILRTFADTVLPQLHLGARVRRVLGLLAACGTPQLGFTLYECPHCHGRHGVARSCGDRHCPRCLAAKSRHWLTQQTRSLLPTTYYHCVFTLPEDLNALVLLNPTRLYPLLFDSAAQSLLQFGRNRLHGNLGISAVLHTWGQQLNFHPHLHCIVTGGALSSDGQQWRAPKQRKFLFPVKALGALFRGKFLDALKGLLATDQLRLSDPSMANPQVRQRWFSKLYAQKWVVYAKRPFGGPEQVLNYLANYTHRVALSNRRIVAVDEQAQTVTFTWRDYRHGGKVKPLTLSAHEFLRRFIHHILPAGLVRIRHYGILGNNRRQRDIARARALLERRRQKAAPQLPKLKPLEPMPCPHCGRSGLRWIGFIDAKGRAHLKTRSATLDSS